MGEPSKKKPVFDDKDQSKAFLETAREHGATGKSPVASNLIGRLAKQPPKPRPKKKT